MVASRPGLGDVHGTGKGTARRHRSRFRQYLPSVCPVRFSPARFSPVRFSYGPGFIRRFQLSVSPVRFSSVRFTPIRFSYGPDFIRRFQLHGYFTFFLRPDPVTDMPPRDHPPPSGHPSPLALRALGSRGDTPRQPGLFLLRQRLSFLILTFHIFPVCKNGFFPELPYCLHLTNLQPIRQATCAGLSTSTRTTTPFHNGRDSRDSVPLWQAGFVAAPPRGRSEPFSRSAPFHNGRESRDSVPLRQTVVVRPVSVLPRFSPPVGMSTGRQNVSDRKELSMRRGTIRRAKIRTPRRGQWDAFGRLAQ